MRLRSPHGVDTSSRTRLVRQAESALNGNLWASILRKLRPVLWLEGRELPDSFRGARSERQQCFQDALDLAGRADGGLQVVFSFSFRPQADIGIKHVLCLDADGLPVDPLPVRRLALPSAISSAERPICGNSSSWPNSTA